MSAIFKINQLGAIKDSEITYKPLMLFSGESGTGKSYTAFLNYILADLLSHKNKDLEKYILTTYSTDLDKIVGEENFKFTFKLTDFCLWFKKYTKQKLSYLINFEHVICDIELILDQYDFVFSFEYNARLFPEYKIYAGYESFPIEGFNLSINQNNFIPIQRDKEQLNAILAVNIKTAFKPFKKVFILPAARGALVDFNFNEKTAASSTGMYAEFFKDMDEILAPSQDTNEVSEELSKLIQSIFQGEIKEDRGFLSYEKENVNIPISAAASSMKELAPLFLMLKKYAPEKLSILFEEPEAHLHASLQQKIALLIGYLVSKGASLQITTHSDYFLNQINHLLRLNKLKTENESLFQEAVQELGWSTAFTLKPEQVGAYFLQKQEDGSVKIIEQDVQNGVPFDSFEKPTERMIEESEIIEEYLEKLTNND